jgi:hypothetical protein
LDSSESDASTVVTAPPMSAVDGRPDRVGPPPTGKRVQASTSLPASAIMARSEVLSSEYGLNPGLTTISISRPTVANYVPNVTVISPEGRRRRTRLVPRQHQGDHHPMTTPTAYEPARTKRLR